MLPRFHSRCASALACLLLASSAALAQVDIVRAQQKISETAGGLGNVLMQDYFGFSVVSLGDLDGDGVGDIAVGAPYHDDGIIGSEKGAVWVLFLNPDGTVRSTQKISDTSGGLVGALQFGEYFGVSVASLGDLNGDGVGELAVGSQPGGFQGRVWILFLNTDGTVADEQTIAEGVGGFGGSLEADDRFGSAFAPLGDLDGDGVGDLAVAAYRDDDVLPDQGSVWILFLRPDGTVASEQKISASEGGFGGVLGQGGGFGRALAPLGDLDGDGVGDLAVGTFGPEALWILFLNSDGTVRAEQEISATEGGFGGDPGAVFGAALASLGDVDRDGVGDLAVGAWFDDEVWILFLNPDGTVAFEQEISATTGGFSGEVTGDLFGASLGSLGDLDGDGGVDLAVGAYLDDDGGIDQGAVWILFLAEHLRLDFETEDDFATPLANGQDISTPPEFGRLVALASSGPNAGAAIFDSTPGGPNDPSQDRDLLVGSGNVLMLQTNENTTQTVPGRFDRPNDDEDGGSLTLAFTRAVEPRSIDLVDIDSGADEASSVVLTDELGRLRVFTVPPGWTGDLLANGIGRRTLDLAVLAPQPGFSATATVFEDPGFAPDRVVSLELQLGSSGALDNLVWLPRPGGLRGRPPRNRAQPVPPTPR